MPLVLVGSGQTLRQQGTTPALGAVLQVMMVVEAGQLWGRAGPAPFPGAWPSPQLNLWGQTVWHSPPWMQGEQGTQAATVSQPLSRL